MTFDEADAFVAPEEGGISNDPFDPGKLTKYGISEVYYPQVRDPNFSPADAKAIRKKDFWDFCHCDELPGGLALMLYDARINQTKNSIIMLQQALGGLTVDGKLGTLTLAKAKAATGPEVLNEFFARRMQAYGLNPLFTRDGLGWSRRLGLCYALALKS